MRRPAPPASSRRVPAPHGPARTRRVWAALALACTAHTASAADPVDAAHAAERAASVASSAIRAGAAHARGLDGRGAVVAVLDTGTSAAHPELAGRVLVGFDAVAGAGTAATDPNGHGTWVAAVVAAALDGRGMHGVAPGARVLPVRVLDATGLGSSAQLDAGLRALVRSGAPIANLSVGASSPLPTGALRETVAAGVLLVVAAGNRGAADPDWPARHARDAWAAGRILAVGALDASGAIAAYSNRAGDAREFFLVAPGTASIAGTDGGHSGASGTSMAAPAIAGAAALLKQAWPWLRAEQLAGVLLATATDLGAPGTDAVYGRGRVDVERALQPVGTLAVRAPDGTVSPAAGSGLRTTAATAALPAAAAQGAFRVAALDAYGRDFEVDLGAGVVRQPSPLALERVFGRLGEQLVATQAVLPGGLRLELLSSEPAAPRGDTATGVSPAAASPLAAVAPLAAAGPTPLPALRSLALTWTQGPVEVSAAAGALAGRGFGLPSLAVAEVPLAGLPGLASPWLSLAAGGTQLATGLALGDWRLRFGLLGNGGASAVATLPGLVDPARAQAAVLEASRAIGAARVAATLSATRESEALLGARASGALALAGGRTQAFELSAALPVAARTALVGSLGVGATQGPGLAALAGTTALSTRAAALALVRADVWVPGDRVALSVAQPMRASGDWTMTVPVGAAADGSLRYATRTLPMTPGGRELATEASWWRPIGRDRSVSLTFGLRTQPDHDAQARADAMVAIRFAGTF